MKSNLASDGKCGVWENNSADASTANNMTGLATGFIGFTKVEQAVGTSDYMLFASSYETLVEHL